MFWSRMPTLALLTACLGGCGTYVPELREWPNYSQADTQNMIQAIVRSVRCELRNAVTKVVNNDLDAARQRQTGKTYSNFLDNWGAEVLLTFTIVEKSTTNPNVLLTPASPASSVFTLAAGLDLSAQATRIEKMNLFYTVRELYLPKGVICDASGEQRYDSFLIQNNLKIADLFYGRMGSAVLGNASLPQAQDKNVLSHEISFQVVSSGGVSPTWTLTRAAINPTGTLLGGSRDRTHDLLITFGPRDKPRGGRSLIAIAEQAHFSSQIASGVSNGFRSSLAR